MIYEKSSYPLQITQPADVALESEIALHRIWYTYCILKYCIVIMFTLNYNSDFETCFPWYIDKRNEPLEFDLEEPQFNKDCKR